MEISFGICPHLAETENKKFWTRFAKRIEHILNEPVSVLAPSDFEKEHSFLKEKCCYLYYARPEIALQLYEKGYKPLAFSRIEKNEIFLIKHKKGFSRESLVRIASMKSNCFVFPLMKLGFELNRINLVFTKSHLETYEKVKRGEAEAGIIFADVYYQIQDDEKPEVLVGTSFPFLHFLMAHTIVYDRVSEILTEFPELIPVSDEEINLLKETMVVNSRLFELQRRYDLYSTVFSIPFVGILISSRDKILYSNEYARKVLGYSEEEMKRINLADICVGEAIGERLKNDVETSCSGARISDAFELRLKRRDGASVFLDSFLQTFFCEGDYSTLIIFVDITDKKRVERIYSLLRGVNKLATSVSVEDELFKGICHLAVKELGLRFAWIGLISKGTYCLNPVYSAGYGEDYLESIPLSFDPDKLEGAGPTGIALKRGDIIINSDTRSNPYMIAFKDEALKRGYLSSCAVPLYKNNEIYAVLNLYADESHYFSENVYLLLKEVQRDLNYALEKISQIEQNMVLRIAIENARDFVIVTDDRLKIIFVNQGALNISGYGQNELLDKNIRETFCSNLSNSEVRKNKTNAFKKGRSFSGMVPGRAKNGEIFYLYLTVIPIKLPNGEKRYVGVGKDITREINLSSELERNRFYDFVTTLYNLNGLIFKVDEVLKMEDKELSALCILDLYNFTYVNHSLGIKEGDKLLFEFGNKLKKYFPEKSIIARVASDEFALFLHGLRTEKDIFEIGARIRSLTKEYYNVKGDKVRLPFNCGIAIYPRDSKALSDLFQMAGIALKKAKEEGPDTLTFFDAGIEGRARDYVKVGGLIDRALEKKLFLFYYQPYFWTYSKTLAGFEALVRIQDEDGTLRFPREFIDHLEQGPYITDFEEWALYEVASFYNKWKINTSFNVSGKSFVRPEFVEKLYEVCYEGGARLTIEITERLLLEKAEETRRVIDRLKSDITGNTIKIAVDDFGTGYSSLNYLRNLPVDILKIDISFIRNMLRGKKELAIVETIISLAHAIGARALAEGVETEEQFNILRELGCDLVQGYLFDKPLHPRDVERRLKKGLYKLY